MRQELSIRNKKSIWKVLGLGLGVLAYLGGGAVWAAASSDQVGLRLTVDKSQLEVGDSLTLTLEFKQIGSGNGIEAQTPSIATPENFELRGNQMSTQVIESNGNVYEVMTTKCTLVATKEGVEDLGPASLIYQDPKTGRQEIQSNTVRVTVTPKSAFSFFGHKAAPAAAVTPAPSADDLQDVKPLVPHYGVLGIFIWILAAILIVGFAARLWKRKPVKSAAPASSPEDDDWRDSLKKLFNEDLPAKDFCLKLSVWTRECLADRYGFPAEDYTTSEILKALRGVKAPPELQEAAEKCLRVCDRVLYAEGMIGSKDNLKAWALVLAPRAKKK